MGSDINKYELWEYKSDDQTCTHHLLTRVPRGGFSNASEDEYNQAESEYEKDVQKLRSYFSKTVLPESCKHSHSEHLIGKLEECPIGEEFYGEPSKTFTIWVCGTKYGYPHVVMGTAENEKDFWIQLNDSENDDLLALNPISPAREYCVYFLAK